jgi:hypothetical protein
MYHADPNWNLSVTSLSAAPIAVHGKAGWVWQPLKSDIDIQPFSQAASPASEQSIRLEQMQKLATRVTVHQLWDNDDRPLRLLPKPVHRYDDPTSGLVDGALFILSDGANPSLAILIEAIRRNGRTAEWGYGFARIGSAEYHATVDGREVWKCNRVGITGSADPYGTITQPMSN